MSDAKDQLESFLPLRRAATRLGVPLAWLRAEANAARVPHLRVGRRLLVNPQAVEKVLLERAPGWWRGGDVVSAETEVIPALLTKTLIRKHFVPAGERT